MQSAYFVRAATVTENLLKRRWSDVILRHISIGATSAARLCEREPDLTPVIMNERLRTMLRYSLIAREPARASPKVATYRITDRGRKLLKLLSLIEQFDAVEDIVIQSTASGMVAISNFSLERTDPEPIQTRLPSTARLGASISTPNSA